MTPSSEATNKPQRRTTITTQQIVPRLRWTFATVSRALGLYGWVAVLLLLGALVFQRLVISSGDRLLDVRQHAALDGIALHPEQAERLEVAEPKVLPSANDFMQRLAGINALLQSFGFAHAEASYQQTDLGDLKLRRLVVEMPLRGPYPPLRAALDDLAKQPGVRIEHLQLTRKRIGDDQLDIVLRFSLLGTLP